MLTLHALIEPFKGSKTLPSTTPNDIKTAKQRTLALSELLVWGALIFGKPLLTGGLREVASVSWLSFGALWGAALTIQAWYLAQLYGTDVWTEPLAPRSSLLSVAKPVFTLFLASTSFSLLFGSPQLILGCLMGIIWWLLIEEHPKWCIRQCFVKSIDPAHPSYLTEIRGHFYTLMAWNQHYWKALWISDLTMGVAVVVLTMVSWLWGGTLGKISFYVPVLTLIWMSGFVRFHEVLNSPAQYGDNTDPKSLERALPSINSQDTIIKGYGLGHLRWLMQFGGALGQHSRNALFATGVPNPWDVCAQACVFEIEAMSKCIAAMMGHVPDISATTLMVSPMRARDTALRIQHKYTLLITSVRCLMGMAEAAVQRGGGSTPYTQCPLGNVLTCIFEGHAFITYFERVTKGMSRGWWPVEEVWATKPLLKQFDLAGFALWNAYGKDLGPTMKPSQLLSEGVMKSYTHHFTHRA